MTKKIENMPNHIAVIPDGNRRWAKKHKLKAWLGHKRGTDNLEKILAVIIEKGIKHISFWGSSKDNLKKRSKYEVKFLLNLFKDKFSELSTKEIIHKNKIKISIFGDWRKQFPESIKKSMEKAIEATKNYNNHFLNFFIAYSGTGEIIDAIKCVVKKSKENASLEINEDLLKKCLLTRDLPKVDLMIRSGGEPHLSDGFMMWDVANAQLYFSDKLWPDFTDGDFKLAIEEFGSRKRKFGS